MPVEVKEEQYHVYGRKAYAEPLQYVMSVSASGIDSVAADSPEAGEEDWIELIAFPASAAIHVIPWERSDERDE